MQASRALSVIALSQCRFNYDGPVSFPTSVWPGFGVVLGARGAYLRGAVVAALVSLLAVVMIGLWVVIILTVLLRCGMSDAMKTLRFPAGVLTLAIGLVLDGLVTCAVATAVHGESREADIALTITAGVVIVTITGFGIWVGMAASQACCEFTERREVHHRGDTGVASNRQSMDQQHTVPYADVSTTGENNNTTAVMTVDDLDTLLLGPQAALTSQQLAPTSEVTAESQESPAPHVETAAASSSQPTRVTSINEKSSLRTALDRHLRGRSAWVPREEFAAPVMLSHFFRVPAAMHGALGSFYKKYRGGRQWYYMMDVVMTVLVSGTKGSMPATVAGCTIAMWVMVVLCGIALISASVLRPYAVPVKNGLVILASGLTFVGSLMVLGAMQTDNATALGMGQMCALLAGYVSLGNVIIIVYAELTSMKPLQINNWIRTSATSIHRPHHRDESLLVSRGSPSSATHGVVNEDMVELVPRQSQLDRQPQMPVNTVTHTAEDLPWDEWGQQEQLRLANEEQERARQFVLEAALDTLDTMLSSKRYTSAVLGDGNVAINPMTRVFVTHHVATSAAGIPAAATVTTRAASNGSARLASSSGADDADLVAMLL